LNELGCNEPNALERNRLHAHSLEAIRLDNEFYHLHGFGRGENGFEHIGVYDGTDNEFYHLHDNGRDAIMDLPHQLPDISEFLMMLRENYDSSKDELSPFSPRDRDIPTESPLEGGSVLNLAGQASTEGLEKNPVITAVPKQELLDSTLTSHCERITTTVARNKLELNDILPLDINWLHASYYIYPLPPGNGILQSDDLTLMTDDLGDTRNPATLRQHDQESEDDWIADHEMAQLNDDVLREQNRSTEQIIASFESLCNSSDDEITDFFRIPPDSSDDDINENTDTEDGTEELIELIGANTDLMAFLAKQRATIARLRARIVRLNDLLARYESQNGQVTEDITTVLIDTVTDTSFLLKPNCDSNINLDFLDNPKVNKELQDKLAQLQNHKVSDGELWMYFGASRSVISTVSPIRKHLKGLMPAYVSCSIGNGTPLQYIEKGQVKENLDITVVEDLKYDLFSSVSAAKQGLTSIIDFDLKTGKNNSYTIDKTNGCITPLIERGRGILELPLHLMLQAGTCLASTHTAPQMQADISPNVISMFWHGYEDQSFDPTTRENNKTEYALFTFDIIKSLNERERDFSIHARLGHLPRKRILQMIKNGTTGIGNYSGKFQELCKPCMQAKQRAENHGHEHIRHPNGRPGEHLHSDLAVLSTLDINGNKYVLTVVDEVSHEIVIALLKRKTAEDVCRVSKKNPKHDPGTHGP
jgi:hypothetical protein